MSSLHRDPGAFADCNVVLGRLSSPFFDSWFSTAALIEEMDRYGISHSLVTHSFGREISQEIGNRALVDELAGSDRLIPVATLFPRHGQVDPGVEEQLASVASAFPTFAARVHPNPTFDVMDEAVHPRHFFFRPEVVGDLCEWLSGRKIPLLVDMPQVDWPAIHSVLEAFPALPLLLLDVGYPHKRSLFSALERYSNLHFETSGFHVHEGLEEFVRSFGSSRLLFGSRGPRYTAASAVAMVQYADITDPDKENIRGANLFRLLAGNEK